MRPRALSMLAGPWRNSPSSGPVGGYQSRLAGVPSKKSGMMMRYGFEVEEARISAPWRV